jgi:hypothetical protein
VFHPGSGAALAPVVPWVVSVAWVLLVPRAEWDV